MSQPIGFTNAQIGALRIAAQPLCQCDRIAFTEAVAARLAGLAEVGDGQLHRAMVEALKEGRWKRQRFFPGEPARDPDKRVGYHRTRA